MNNPLKKRYVVSMALLGVFAFILLWRCQYTFCQTDESFYLSLVHRFWNHEQPLVDEWNSAQIYAPLLLPFYSLYRMLVGSVDGVYLAARVCFTAITCGMGYWIYIALREKGNLQALMSALLFMSYSKANIAGFSYYNMALCFLTAGLLILYRTNPDASTAVPRGILAGAVMALAVLCNPVTALGWAVLLPMIVIRRFARVRKLALSLVVGTGLSAVCYLVWLLQKVGLQELFWAIPNLLSDPEANTSSSNLFKLLLGLLSAPAHFIESSPLWVTALAVTCWYGLVKRQKMPEKVQKVVLLTAFCALLINVAFSYPILGQSHSALCLFGFQCYLLTPREGRNQKSFLCFFLPGVAFAVIWQLSSNTRFSGMTIGFALSAVAACGMVSDMLRDNRLFSRQQGMALLFAALFFPFAMGAFQRVALEYRDAPLPECTQKLHTGPAAGLYTTPEHAAQYEELVALLTSEEIADSEGRLFVSSLLPWAYLCTDRACGAPSTWRTPLDNVQLPAYYEQAPERFPTTVIVLQPQVGSYVSTLQPEQNNEANINAAKGSFMELALQEKGYIISETTLATVYQAP